MYFGVRCVMQDADSSQLLIINIYWFEFSKFGFRQKFLGLVCVLSTVRSVNKNAHRDENLCLYMLSLSENKIGSYEKKAQNI